MSNAPKQVSLVAHTYKCDDDGEFILNDEGEKQVILYTVREKLLADPKTLTKNEGESNADFKARKQSHTNQRANLRAAANRFHTDNGGEKPQARGNTIYIARTKDGLEFIPSIKRDGAGKVAKTQIKVPASW